MPPQEDLKTTWNVAFRYAVDIEEAFVKAFSMRTVVMDKRMPKKIKRYRNFISGYVFPLLKPKMKVDKKVDKKEYNGCANILEVFESKWKDVKQDKEESLSAFLEAMWNYAGERGFLGPDRTEGESAGFDLEKM